MHYFQYISAILRTIVFATIGLIIEILLMSIKIKIRIDINVFIYH